MAKSIDICCPQCGRTYHTDESHLGKSIRCVQCGKIFLLIVGEPPASEQGPSAIPEVQSCPQGRNSQRSSVQSTASTVRARYTSSLGWVVRGLNRPQKFVVALATFAFLLTAVRPPFVIGRGVRYRWLWSHSGSRIELTRLLVEWVLIVVTGALVLVLLEGRAAIAPGLAFRRWWSNRSTSTSKRTLAGLGSSRFRRYRTLLIGFFLLLTGFGLLTGVLYRRSREHQALGVQGERPGATSTIAPSSNAIEPAIDTGATNKSVAPGEQSPTVSWDVVPSGEHPPRRYQRSSLPLQSSEPLTQTETHKPASLTTGTRADKSRSEWGVDTAVPLRTIWLYGEPSTTSKGIKRLDRGHALVLIRREPENGWYNVFDIPTGKEGWVSTQNVRTAYTKHPLPPPKFSEEYVGNDENPSIKVINETHFEMGLRIGDAHYVVPSGTPFQVSPPVGVWEFFASAPGAIPASGKKEFRRGYRYEWTFWIERTILPMP